MEGASKDANFARLLEFGFEDSQIHGALRSCDSFEAALSQLLNPASEASSSRGNAGREQYDALGQPSALENQGGQQCGECRGRGVTVQVVRMGPMIQQMQSACVACNGRGRSPHLAGQPAVPLLDIPLPRQPDANRLGWCHSGRRV